MIPKTYRLAVKNGTGVNQENASGARITVAAVPWRKLASGRTQYGPKEIIYALASGQTLDDGSYARSDVQRNDPSGWDGVDVFLAVTTHGAANSDVTCYLEASDDGGTTTWQTNGNGQSVCALPFASATTKRAFGRI
ncbi:MAG: hypothetical protein AMXMBFR13_45900 [Phycisphaerae bacterium]